MTTITEIAAGLEYGSVLEFVQINLNDFGAGVFNAYNSRDITDVDGAIEFQGVTWNPVPFESEGWGFDGTGSTPRPTITIADPNALLYTAAQSIQGAVGAQIIRYETTVELFASGEYYQPEIWIINRIIQADGFILKFEMAAPYDQALKKIPAINMYRREYPGLGRQ